MFFLSGADDESRLGPQRAVQSGLLSEQQVRIGAYFCFGIALLIGIYLGPSFAIAQTLAPIHMRAMSTALFFFILNMIALGGGPTFAGWIMDLFKESYNELESVRYAMTVTSIFFIPSVISFLLVAKVLPRDWKAAEERNLKLAK